MKPKVNGALIQAAGAAVVLLAFAALSIMNNVADSDPRLEQRATVMGLVIWLVLMVAGGWLYRQGRRLRNPEWKPGRSFHLSR